MPSHGTCRQLQNQQLICTRPLGLLWPQLGKDARHPITQKPVCISLATQPTCDLKGDQARLSGCSKMFPPIKCSSLKKFFLSCRAVGMKLPPAEWSVSRLKSTNRFKWTPVQSCVGHQTRRQRMLHAQLCVHAGRKGHSQQLPSTFCLKKKSHCKFPWNSTPQRPEHIQLKGQREEKKIHK